MFEYLDKIFKDTQQPDELEGKVKVFELDNVFSKEHYEKLSHDVVANKKYTKEDAPIEGEEPSVITWDHLENTDEFYKILWQYFNSDETKLNVLRKFGYFIREDQEDTILRCLHQTVSFHTEYPHQVDGEHTDQKYTLQTFTIQVYLPTDDSIKDYGTQFVNHDRETVYHRSFLPNTGYMMASNNNSWHKPTMGVERKSLLVRYHLEIDYNKHQRLFNYNKDNDTCYVVWNKYMDVHPKITDWMATMTFINLIDHKFENIATTVEPFKNDLLQLRRLKKQGFKKAVVFFGGFVWATDWIKQYADNLDLKKMFVGMPFEDEFARQCFILNLDRLDEIKEEDARDGFFTKYMGEEESIDISEDIWSNRKYYHPEDDEQGAINNFIRFDNDVEHIKNNHPELYSRVKYMVPYRKNYTDLSSMTSSMNDTAIKYCNFCSDETLMSDVTESERIAQDLDLNKNFVCTVCNNHATFESLTPSDYDENKHKRKFQKPEKYPDLPGNKITW